jgi:hypothetical protein
MNRHCVKNNDPSSEFSFSGQDRTEQEWTEPLKIARKESKNRKVAIRHTTAG